MRARARASCQAARFRGPLRPIAGWEPDGTRAVSHSGQAARRLVVSWRSGGSTSGTAPLRSVCYWIADEDAHRERQTRPPDLPHSRSHDRAPARELSNRVRRGSRSGAAPVGHGVRALALDPPGRARGGPPRHRRPARARERGAGGPDGNSDGQAVDTRARRRRRRGTVRTERAERFVRRLESGSVIVNGLVRSDPRLPFGGVKESGFGRELSREGLRELVNVKTVWIA